MDELRHIIGWDVAAEIRPDWVVTSHPAAFRVAYSAQCFDPEQIEEFDVFIQSLREGCILFDLGTHFGLFSLAALHFGGEQARAIAVDSSPEAMRMIRLQARQNQISEDRLRLVRAAIGSDSGQTDMVATGVFSAGYYVARKASHSLREVTATPMISVDNLAERFGVQPTHLKIDVEGAELATLRGSTKTLRAEHPPRVCWEVHNQIIRENGCDPREILTFLYDTGYVITRLCGVPSFTETSILERDVARLFAHPRTRVEIAL